MFSIANCLTASNLFFGCLGIVSLFRGDYQYTVVFSICAALADLLDGWIARLLNQQSELGQELDSLADVVSFGVLPSCIAYQIMNGIDLDFGLPYIAFLLAVMAAFRLARFNLKASSKPSPYFQGVPVPMMGIFFTGFLSVYFQETTISYFEFIVLASVLLFSFLMISHFPIVKLMINKKWMQDHWLLLLLCFLGACLYPFIGFLCLNVIVLLWILYSFFQNKNRNHEISSKN